MNIEIIPSEKISVVIQGLLHRNSPEGDLALRAIASIRQYLPAAEIIISTWPTENIDGLSVEQIIISPEPMSLYFNVPEVTYDAANNPHVSASLKTNNVLKQIVSSAAGIKAATRPYVLKFRADLYLINAAIAQLRHYPAMMRSTKRLFKQPLTISTLFLRHSQARPLAFHIPDVIHFGVREDLLDFWAGNFPYLEPEYAPEQVLTDRFLKKRGVACAWQPLVPVPYKVMRYWEKIMVEQFYILDLHETGVIFPQRFYTDSPELNYTIAEIKKIKLLFKFNLYDFYHLNLSAIFQLKKQKQLVKTVIKKLLPNKILQQLKISYRRLRS